MRLTQLANLRFDSGSRRPLRFSGPRGERFQVTVLDHDLIRVEHYPDGAPRLDRTWMVVDASGGMPREGRRRDDLAPFPLPEFDLTQDGDTFNLQTQRLHLRLESGRLHLRWADAARREFAADLARRAYLYDRGGRSVSHYLERRSGEHYYGFGEKSGPLDKAGMRLRMVNIDALGYNAETTDPLYKHWPFYITYVPEFDTAYGLFYDNLATSVFDLGKEVNALFGSYRSYQAEDGDLDYYFIYGPTIPEVIEKFTALTGRPALPPRWSLGYLGSTMHYTEAPDAGTQLRQFVALCAQHDIPCDMFHLSSGYTTDAAGRRNVFTWNRQRIPDPQGMAAYFHAAGIRLTANIKPYLLTTHPQYAEVKAAGGFIQAADRDAPERLARWSGGINETDPAASLDLTSAAGFAWWQAGIKAALLDYGIDGLWNDNNEFEVWDDAARCDGFGQQIPVSLARPLQTLLMGMASYEALAAYRPAQRPYVISRAGCPGIQRYAQSWSGDNATSWHTLQYNLPMGLGSGLSGMPNTGHDVGGFVGGPPEPELLARWVQAGIFFPRFTIHSLGESGIATAPWMYPDLLPVIREAIRFRYRLIPYLYSLFVEAARTGQPVMRPLVYHYPGDTRCRVESFDFLLGERLLVAPVYAPGQESRDVYLPPGTQWHDFYSGAWHNGGDTVTLAAPPEHIPLLVAAGGILPMGKVMRHSGQQPDDLRRVYVYPGPQGGASRFTLVEDDGLSLDYQRGGFRDITIALEASPEAISLQLAQEGDYALPYAQLEFILPVGEERPVSGVAIARQWQDEAGRRHFGVAIR